MAAINVVLLLASLAPHSRSAREIASLAMANEIVKSEHAGPKNGGGAWMARAEAKRQSNRRRRLNDRRLAERERHELSHSTEPGTGTPQPAQEADCS
jgi:hypothetical protein